MKWNGTVIGESLIDQTSLSSFIINRIEVTEEENEKDRWHIYYVSAEELPILDLEHAIKDGPWYAHFWNNEELIIIFKGKTIRLRRDDAQVLEVAKEYGRSIGIPEEQLDFTVESV